MVTNSDFTAQVDGKASKEFVISGFFVALVLQFVGFLVIADMKVDPVREDVVAIKSAVEKLAVATDTHLGLLTSLDSSVNSLGPSLKSQSVGFEEMTSIITETKFAVENFSTVYAMQPAETKGNPEALKSNFLLFFNGLPETSKSKLIEELENIQ